MKYTEFIKVREGFQTSVNLEYDLNQTDKIKGYIPTEQSVKVLGYFLKTFYYGKAVPERASVLIGPYGRGKSHLLLVLTALTSMDVFGVKREEKRNMQDILKELCGKITTVDSEIGALASQVVKTDIRILPVIINSNSNDINQAFLAALHNALSQAGLQTLLPTTYFDAALTILERWEREFPDAYDKLVAELKKEKRTVDQLRIGLKRFDDTYYEMFCKCYPLIAAGTEFNPFTNMDVVKLYMAVANALCEQTEYTGLHVIFDEFSKFLESNLDERNMRNFKIIQDMAEAAARSSDKQIHFTCVTQKGILDYAVSDSFKTVEGRFVTIPFVASSEQSYELIANALYKSEKFELVKKQYQKSFREVIDRSFVNVFEDLSEEAFEKKLVYGCFPLSPLSAFMLLRVSELVGQNERTLFTFLAQDTVNALVPFLEEERETLDFISVDRIYDYFEELFKKELFNKKVHSLWSKTSSAINQTEDVSQEKIIKAIGLINIIGDERLKTIPAHIKMALLMMDEEFETAIRILQKKHVLLQRDSSEFVLLTANGVDIQKNIEDYINTHISKLKTGETLNEFCPLRYVLPREHNDKFCTLRYFKRIFMEAEVFIQCKDATQLLLENGCDGLIIYIIEMDGVLTRAVREHLYVFEETPQIVLCMSKINFTSEYLLKELVAIKQLEKTEIARQDSHYMEEIKVFEEDLQKQLISKINEMFAPGSVHSYFVNSRGTLDISRQVELNQEISRICDHIYFLTPRINNEMVNKKSLNSQNIKGREMVIDWVLAHAKEKEIPCMSGFGQEVSIFKAMFKHTGLDKRQSVEDEGINSTLQQIQRFLLECDGERNTFEKLYKILMAPPYGIRKGVIPLFIAYVFRLYKENIVIYFKEKEVEFSASVLGSINEKPESFELLLEQGTQEREKYLTSLLDLFSGYFSEKEAGINKVYTVVRCMQNWIRSLPEYTKKFHRYFEEGIQKEIPKVAERIRMDLLKFEINSQELLFLSWQSLLSKSGSLEECFEAIKETKLFLDHHVAQEREELIRKLTDLFIPGYQGGFSLAVMSWYKELPDGVKQHVFDNDTNPLLNIVAGLSTYNDEELLDKFVMALVSIGVEDWNDRLAAQFIEKVSKAVEVVNGYQENEGKTGGNGTVMLRMPEMQIEKTFDVEVISPLGETILNNLRSVFEEYNGAINSDEQMAILIKLIGDIID